MGKNFGPFNTGCTLGAFGRDDVCMKNIHWPKRYCIRHRSPFQAEADILYKPNQRSSEPVRKPDKRPSGTLGKESSRNPKPFFQTGTAMH